MSGSNGKKFAEIVERAERLPAYNGNRDLPAGVIQRGHGVEYRDRKPGVGRGGSDKPCTQRQWDRMAPDIPLAGTFLDTPWGHGYNFHVFLEVKQMKRTYQPNTRKRKKNHGFRKRMSTRSGRAVLKEEEAKRQKEVECLKAQWKP